MACHQKEIVISPGATWTWTEETDEVADDDFDPEEDSEPNATPRTLRVKVHGGRRPTWVRPGSGSDGFWKF